jgi:hypothetical protein
MLDSLAHRYKLLPSEVIQRGDTLDVLVMETTLQWQRRQRELAEAKSSGKAPPAAKLTQQQMLDMMKRVKERKDEV